MDMELTKKRVDAIEAFLRETATINRPLTRA